MRNIFRNIFLATNIIVAIALLASYLVQDVNPSHFWIPSVIGLAYPYFLLANLFFIPFWIIVRKKFFLISLICLLVGIHINSSYFQLVSHHTSKTDGIKVFSYNVQNFENSSVKNKNRIAMINYIGSQKADIICLQEVKFQKSGDFAPEKLKNSFSGIKYYNLAHQTPWSVLSTFTKYPILSTGELRFDDTNNMVIFTDLKMGKDVVRVYNCHLQSYGINTSAYSVLDTLGFESKKIREMRKIGSKLKWGNIYRSKQVIKLTNHIARCPYPVIVCGDFNDTPISFTYGKMTSKLNDSFVESGCGISNTYRGKLPQNRIDYIFHSSEFKAYNYKRLDGEYSDHFPISTLLIKKK